MRIPDLPKRIAPCLGEICVYSPPQPPLIGSLLLLRGFRAHSRTSHTSSTFFVKLALSQRSLPAFVNGEIRKNGIAKLQDIRGRRRIFLDAIPGLLRLCSRTHRSERASKPTVGVWANTPSRPGQPCIRGS